MTEEAFKSLMERGGVHSFVFVMSTKTFLENCRKDLQMRSIIAVLAAFAVIGYVFVWRNSSKSSELQIRLVRASELNTHLRGMNLAAAGLAHETRNPLNIIRGLAQMISKTENAAPEVRQKSREITDEVDRVTAQLNEFINYSRPREVAKAPVALNAVISEVVRALNYDIEEKAIQVEVQTEPITIEADEQQLRQALFNLLLNAVQAVESKGEIQIRADRRDTTEGWIEVRDNGPGVAEDQRLEIFMPYFTTNKKGTGLGLAVVQQIVLAHGWEIRCLANEPKGAIFRISHLKLASRA